MNCFICMIFLGRESGQPSSQVTSGHFQEEQIPVYFKSDTERNVVMRYGLKRDIYIPVSICGILWGALYQRDMQEVLGNTGGNLQMGFRKLGKLSQVIKWPDRILKGCKKKKKKAVCGNQRHKIRLHSGNRLIIQFGTVGMKSTGDRKRQWWDHRGYLGTKL